MKFLYAAYGFTWLIHMGYLATLVTRSRRLQREIRELAKK